MNYIIYETISKEIIENGHFDQENGIVVVPDNCAVLYVVGSSADGYVDNGQYVEYTAEQKQRKALRPHPFLGKWSNEDFQWHLGLTSEQEQAQLTNTIKEKRGKLLYESDWTQIPNNPLTNEQQQAWAVYRQALRDVPAQAGFPWNIQWPEQP